MCIVERGASLKTVTSCVELGGGKARVDRLYHDVLHVSEDLPPQLPDSVADVIHQRVDPFGAVP
jgi:hypothetical protein